VVRVHRWLFYVSLVVVIGSALSRIEDDGQHEHRDPHDTNVLALAGCP
jgi:hypothetical protein